jgi:hypothetical protein
MRRLAGKNAIITGGGRHGNESRLTTLGLEE